MNNKDTKIMKNEEKRKKNHSSYWNITCTCTGALLLGAASISNAAVGFDPVKTTLINGAINWEGYLDVTKAPYNMKNDGTGAWANSNALQDAINDAYANNFAIFFPEGIYLIQKQMECFQVSGEMTDAHVFVGSALGERPIIKLKNNSSGFNDTASPKSLFNYYCSDSGDGTGEEKAAAGYNFVMRGLEFDLGDNPGAIAVDLHAAQGCTIQDCDFGGVEYYAAIQDLCGSGGHLANLEIVGGKYAFYVTTNRPMPVLTGITCINQTDRAFYTNAFTTITIVGFRFEQNNTKHIFELKSVDQKEHLNLIDGSIEYTGSTATKAIWNRNRSIYIRNVYIKNASLLIKNDGKSGWNVSGATNDWSYIGDYQFFHINNRKLINTTISSNAYGENSVVTNSVAPPNDLISRHLWDESTFPHWEMDSTNLITVAPGSNDTTTINQAIADAKNAGHNTVFLGKGDYYLSGSINLEQDTKLFGVSRNLTRLHANFTSPGGYTGMINSFDDAESKNLLAWMAIEMPADQSSNVRHLTWKAGRHSMVREVHFRKDAGNYNCNMKRIYITGNGGGRWYGLFARKGQVDGEDPAHRMLQVNNTNEALSFYAFCVEYQESLAYMTEIKDSSNVSIYGLKVETDINSNDNSGTYRHTTALGINNSDNIMVMGESGLGHFLNGANQGVIEVFNGSTQVMVANADAGWRDEKDYFIVQNKDDNVGLKRIDDGSSQSREPAALYLKGASPTPIVYEPPSSGGGSSSGGGDDIQEFVNTNVIDSSGDVVDWKSNANASEGEFLIYKSNTVGDFLQFQNVNVPSPGDYDIYVGLQTISSAGIIQLQVNNGRNNIGSPVDCYAASSSFQEILFVTDKNFTSGGNKKFAFELTGKNANASDYQIRVDYIKLVPTN